MKKIYSLAAFVLIAATSFAQRNVDLALTLTTPVNGSTVAPSTAQAINFSVSRTGDQVVDGDTIALGYLNLTTGVAYDLQGGANSVSIYILNAQTAPLFNGTTPVTSAMLQVAPLNTTVAGFNLGDTIAVYVDIYANAANPGEDAAFANNLGTFKLGNTASVANLQKVEFSAYPNPATSELTVTSSEDVVSLKIMNMEGKVISSTNGNNIDVSSLNGGVYFYEATTISGATVVNKFVKL